MELRDGNYELFKGLYRFKIIVTVFTVKLIFFLNRLLFYCGFKKKYKCISCKISSFNLLYINVSHQEEWP